MIKGTGKGMVFKTGDNTIMGSTCIAKSAADTGANDTPIAREIHDCVTKVKCSLLFLGFPQNLILIRWTQIFRKNIL